MGVDRNRSRRAGDRPGIPIWPDLRLFLVRPGLRCRRRARLQPAVCRPRPGRHRRRRWPLLPGQIVALAFVTATAVPAIVGVTRHGTVPWVPALVWGAAAGVLGGAANLLFLLATGSGALAVTAVLTALYPAVTVLLAVLLLHERLSVVRGLGLLLAGIAVIAIVLG